MKYLIGILFILTASIGFARDPLSFEHLTIKDGLANNSVRAIFQDKEGYLWIGTLNGLSRYDGQQFKTFGYTHGDSNSISNNKVRDIIQDGAGYIWVLTYDNQAHRFDPGSETFINFPAALGGPCADCSIYIIYESSPGVIWMNLAGEGCVRVVSSPDTPKYSATLFNKMNSLPSNNLNFIKSSVNGGVWIGTNEGLCYLPDNYLDKDDRSRAKFFLTDPAFNISCLYESGSEVWVGCQGGQIFHMEKGKTQLKWESSAVGTQNRNISFIQEAPNGELYVGTMEGLLLIDKNSGKISHFTTGNSDLNSNQILSFYHDKQGDLWLVTDQRGVTRFQPVTKQFTHYPLHPEIRKSILEGEKQVFQEDRNGDLWIGIYGGGVSRFNRKTSLFEQYLHEENNPGSLSSNLILSLFEDRSGNLWAGTYKRGMDKIDLQQNQFHSLMNRSGMDLDFSSEVRAIFEDSRRWIWTGNRQGDIFIYNQALQKQFSLNDLLGKRQLITTGIYSFEEDHDHNIWIGTKGSGIFVLKNLPHPKSKHSAERPTVVRLESNPSDANSLSFNDVFDLHEDRFGQMWVALYHGGVNVIRNPLQSDQEILHYLQNDNDKYALSDNRIRCFLEDKDGNMWIGSANGLNFLSSQYLETDNKKFLQIERTNDPGSLSNKDIICLYQDTEGMIDIGTYGGGLNRLVPGQTAPSFTFEHFGKNDGLSSNLVLSIVEDGNKNLWIGTDFGLCRYRPKANSFESYYVSDGLGENSFSEGRGIKSSSNRLLFGHISGMLWFYPDSIQKSGSQVPVVLTDLLIDGKPNTEKLNSARRIIGDSLRSLKLKYDENFLTFEFAALDYKEPSKVQYEFKLDDYEENWNRSGNLNKAIYRDLKPGDYLFRLKASNSDGLWVNQELKLYLTIAPPPWKTYWAYLIYLLMATGLFLLVRRIVLERIRLKHEVVFEKQLADDKLKFYTSISHEFKTPLALILGPVDDLLDGKDLSPAIKAPLKMVRRNTHRLLELIDQLMDFRKIQKGFFQLERKQGDVVQFLNEIHLAFVPLAERKHIGFNFVCDQSLVIASLDFKSLEKIVFNLLSNAFKHTSNGQGIELKLAVDLQHRQLLISVSDEGDGIREQDLAHLFERFSLGNRSRWKDESSTGIGLSLTKELVELQGGTIAVKSAVGKGSCFTVNLPLQTDKITGETPFGTIVDSGHIEQFIQVVDEDETIELPSANKGQVSKETILVVEDNPDLQNYLTNKLAEKWRVLQALNGIKGLELAQKEDPDLIICDVMMPEMDGLELTRKLKGAFNTSHIPVILLTAKSLEEHKIDGIETGADDYITKPFNMTYLQKRIENILKQRKQLKERFSRDLHAEPKELIQSTADQEFLSKVIRLVEENMGDPDFTIDSLLEHFSFGRTVFYKKMKGISGYSPKDFVRIVRMKRARLMLRENEYSVTQVAFELGFNDSGYFSKLFKKHFGENPSEYQKRQMKQLAPLSDETLNIL